jgi:hypothetical protein
MNPGHRYCMKQLHLTFGSTPALSSRLRRYQDSHKGLQIDPPSSNRAIVQAFYVESLRDVIHIPKLYPPPSLRLSARSITTTPVSWKQPW